MAEEARGVRAEQLGRQQQAPKRVRRSRGKDGKDGKDGVQSGCMIFAVHSEVVPLLKNYPGNS